jgi:hypothetical protein
MNDYKSIDERLDEMLGALDQWIQDERQHFIETNIKEIKRKSLEMKISCDYYIAEFV